jgi:hypothetical protein
MVKRCCFGGPTETPDSKGIVCCRAFVFGRVARMNDAAISEAGIARAKKP